MYVQLLNLGNQNYNGNIPHRFIIVMYLTSQWAFRPLLGIKINNHEAKFPCLYSQAVEAAPPSPWRPLTESADQVIVIRNNNNSTAAQAIINTHAQE